MMRQFHPRRSAGQSLLPIRRHGALLLGASRGIVACPSGRVGDMSFSAPEPDGAELCSLAIGRLNTKGPDTSVLGAIAASLARFLTAPQRGADSLTRLGNKILKRRLMKTAGDFLIGRRLRSAPFGFPGIKLHTLHLSVARLGFLIANSTTSERRNEYA